MRPLPWLVATCAAVDTAAAVKFIELGWDIPDTAFLRAHHRAMEMESPFDGVIFEVSARTDDGRRMSTQAGWSPAPWQRRWFEPALADLRACAFTNFTDNFIRFNATPARLDWADEAAWSALNDKVRICGWLAREAGVKGLAPDFEPYGENQWQYDAGAGRTFATTAALARKRGAGFVRALAAEKPDAVVLALFLNSVVLRAGRTPDPEALLAREHYGLLPAFLNGMLDAAPPEMTFVDGCENGYYLDGVEAYQRTALDLRAWDGPAARLVADANRARYRAQVQAGFGFYLDMFLNEEGHTYYRGPLDGSRLKRLARNLTAARDASDGYVWIYGEQCRWWSATPGDAQAWSNRLAGTAGRGRTWNEALPGIGPAIAWLRNPEDFARRTIAAGPAGGTTSNLLRNGSFSDAPPPPGVLPPGWSAWQHERQPTGGFAWDAGTARATNVTWGCLLQKVPVRPGETYAIQADARIEAPSLCAVTVRWQTSDGDWTHEVDDRTFPLVASTDAWSQAFGVVTIPEGTGQLVVLLDARGQAPSGAACWFDNAALYRLPTQPWRE